MSAKSKLHIALESLSKYEQNRFVKFVKSPYFNKKVSLVNTIQYLVDYIRKNNDFPDKETAWKVAFPNENYDDKKLRKLNNDLLSLFEHFIAIEEFEKDNLTPINMLLGGLSKRNLNKLHPNIINKANRLSERKLEKSSRFYYQQYLLERNIFNLMSNTDRKTSFKSKSFTLNIDKISKNLDIFFIIEKLKYYSSILSWKKLYAIEDEVTFIDEIEQMLQHGDLKKEPVVNMYYRIMKTIKDPDDEQNYFELKDLVNQHIDKFDQFEKREIYEAIVAFCIRKTNSGHQKFQEETFQIYLQALKEEALFVNDQMTPNSFRNIIFFALRTKRIPWAENFIEDYQEYLPPLNRENTVLYNKARLKFYQKDYESVIELLREVIFEDIFLELGSKAILIASYFELKEYDPLDSLLASFSIQLRRNTKLTSTRKLNYSNLIKYTRKIAKLNPWEEVKRSKLIVELTAEKHVASKQWLLEKLEELK